VPSLELWPVDPSRIKVTSDAKGYPLYVLDGKKGPCTSSEFCTSGDCRGMALSD
jgi:hypothetical protein